MSIRPSSLPREHARPDLGPGGDTRAEPAVSATENPDDGTPGPETMVPASLDFHLDGFDNRERALPVRPGDLTRLLLAEPGLTPGERDQLAQFGRILGAMFHSEFYEKLRELKELYAPLDPDSDYVRLKEHTLPRTERSDEDFLTRFETALDRANYRAVPLEAIEAAVTAPNENGLTYSPDFSLFEHMRVWVRGYTRILRECCNLTTHFRKRTVAIAAYQRMVIAVKFKPNKDLGPLVRSDVVYLRLFKDVPHVDMEMHLPEQGTKVRMRWIDKAQIASPLFTGLPIVLAKTLFAAYMASISPLLMGTLIAAPITAGVRSFLGFHSSKQKHLYSMIHRLYYLTIANNASVLTRLVDTAEDEEYKEAMLAYFFLWRHTNQGEPWDHEELDRQIEAFIKEKTGVSINFEVADALHKLHRMGLSRHDELGRLFAIPIDEALIALDHRWDDTFRFA
jgi:hypothetical protein